MSFSFDDLNAIVQREFQEPEPIDYNPTIGGSSTVNLIVRDTATLQQPSPSKRILEGPSSEFETGPGLGDVFQVRGLDYTLVNIVEDASNWLQLVVETGL